jgi:hypothetical protein
MVSLVQEVDSVGNEDSSFVLQYTKVDIVDDLLANMRVQGGDRVIH